MVSIPNKNPLALLAEEEQHHLRKLSRMENEMQEVFNKKIELKLKHLEEIDQNNTKDLQAARHHLDTIKMECRDYRHTIGITAGWLTCVLGPGRSSDQVLVDQNRPHPKTSPASTFYAKNPIWRRILKM